MVFCYPGGRKLLMTNRQPVGREPVGYQPVGYQPVGHESVGHESVGHEPVGHEPVGYQPVGHQTSRIWGLQSPTRSLPFNIGVLNHFSMRYSTFNLIVLYVIIAPRLLPAIFIVYLNPQAPPDNLRPSTRNIHSFARVKKPKAVYTWMSSKVDLQGAALPTVAYEGIWCRPLR